MSNTAVDFPAIVTERLVLRRLEARDAGALHGCLGDPDIMRFWDAPVHETLSETEKVLRRISKTSSQYNCLAWAVARKADGICIGMVNYHNREARHRRLDIGYVIAREHQRQGFGREALTGLLAHSAAAMGVHRVQALIQPGNVPSIALVTSLGFRPEGVLTDHLLVGDHYVSVGVYARTD